MGPRSRPVRMPTSSRLTIHRSVRPHLLAVLFLGREINYSKRWFELGPMRIQPSEFMKLALVLALKVLKPSLKVLMLARMPTPA